MADDSTVNAGLLGFAQIHVRDSNRAEPYWSTTFTQSMYLGIFWKNRNRLIRIQQLSDDVVKNVPRNCQTRVSGRKATKCQHCFLCSEGKVDSDLPLMT